MARKQRNEFETLIEAFLRLRRDRSRKIAETAIRCKHAAYVRSPVRTTLFFERLRALIERAAKKEEKVNGKSKNPCSSPTRAALPISRIADAWRKREPWRGCFPLRRRRCDRESAMKPMNLENTPLDRARESRAV